MARRAVVLAGIIAIIAVACGGGDGDEPDATNTPPPADTATEEPADLPTQPPEADTPTSEPQAADFSLCLLEPSEADEILEEFVTGIPGGNLNCTFQTDSGVYLRIEPGAPSDLASGAELAGVAGEAVAGVGDEAMWFDGVETTSHHFEFDDTVSLGVLSLRTGDVYLRLMLNVPSLDGAAQLEKLTEAAGVAISRLP